MLRIVTKTRLDSLIMADHEHRNTNAHLRKLEENHKDALHDAHKAHKDEVEKIRSNLRDQHELNVRFRDENQRLQDEVTQLKAELDKAKAAEDDHNSVTMVIEGDLTSITPIVRFDPAVQDKLVEAQYLKDGHITNHSIQLALMTIAGEAITQILEPFQQEAVSDE